MKYYQSLAVIALLFASSQAIKLHGVWSDEYDDLFDPIENKSLA